MEAVHGSSLAGVELQQSDNALALTFEALPADGRMLRLSLPEGYTIQEEAWTADAGTLHLVAPVAQGAEVGIVPTADYAGAAVRLELQLVAGQRQTSMPPTGQANLIKDLTITLVNIGVVELAWTQINVGDYNFDGEVNISDLTPMAPRIDSSYDRQAPGADQLTEYWVDGDGNGAINISDITPIGANYQAQVSGYNVRQNGTKLPGAGDAPTVPIEQAVKRTGLPNRYQVQFAGMESDAWAVCPVDSNGIEGADSTGNLGPVDLTATLDIIGLELRDLVTGEVGGFGPGKFSTRVIAPIDIVDRAPIGSVQLVSNVSTIRSLPRERVYMIDFSYAPTVNLATGLPRGGSSVKGASAVPEEDLVTTSFIFYLDEGQQPGEISATIEAKPNPDGSYMLDLSATMDLPGNNPITAVAESGYTDDQLTRQYYAQAEISRDTNGNGSFDDNSRICDPDLDAVSTGLREVLATIDDEDDQFDDGEEMEVDAIIKAIDLCAGSFTLENIVDDIDAPTLYDGSDPNVFYFTEQTEFIERTDEFEDGHSVEPSGFVVGEEVSVDLYPIRNAAGDTVGYWIEKIKRDLRT